MVGGEAEVAPVAAEVDAQYVPTEVAHKWVNDTMGAMPGVAADGGGGGWLRRQCNGVTGLDMVGEKCNRIRWRWRWGGCGGSAMR